MQYMYTIGVGEYYASSYLNASTQETIDIHVTSKSFEATHATRSKNFLW